MIKRNLRHFRVFLTVADLGSPTLAAERCLVSQPAVTQALAKLERETGGLLFDRTRKGFFLTERGQHLEMRLRRAMTRLDAALVEIAPRLRLTTTAPQLQALTAVVEHENYTLAARALGVAQPTVHRAVTQIVREAGRPLFERTTSGLVATRSCRSLSQATRLAFSEIDQAAQDLAEFDGRDVGRIVVGSLPMSRSVVLPQALVRFHAVRPKQLVSVLDGSYDELLAGVRRGEIDFILGALRDPHPIADVVQEPLFDDRIAVIARPGHPLASAAPLSRENFARQDWVVPRIGTPSRAHFDEAFAAKERQLPASLLECGSILLMREILTRSDRLGCISEHQAEAEISRGLLVRLEPGIELPTRSIGLTFRSDWVPTKAQASLLDLVRAAGADVAAA